MGSVAAVNTETKTHANTILLFVTDVGGDIKILVDTGVIISDVLQTFNKKKELEAKGMLYAANASKIAFNFEGFLQLNFSSNLKYSWVFIVANATVQ